MRKCIVLIFSLSLVAHAQINRIGRIGQPGPRGKFPPVRFVVDVRPLSFMISGQADNFELVRGSEKESVNSPLGINPNLRVGIGIDLPVMELGIMTGAGAYWNGDFYGGYYLGDLSFNFRASDKLTIGPHLGFIDFDSVHWIGDAHVFLNNNAGWVGGLAVTYKTGGLCLSLGLDYLDCEIDVRPGSGWSANHEELNISGAMLSLGLMFRF